MILFAQILIIMNFYIPRLKNSYQTNGLTLQRFELILDFDEVVEDVSGPGAGAAATVTIGTGGDAGKITAVTVTNGGAGYVAVPKVLFTLIAKV